MDYYHIYSSLLSIHIQSVRINYLSTFNSHYYDSDIITSIIHIKLKRNQIDQLAVHEK